MDFQDLYSLIFRAKSHLNLETHSLTLILIQNFRHELGMILFVLGLGWFLNGFSFTKRTWKERDIFYLYICQL